MFCIPRCHDRRSLHIFGLLCVTMTITILLYNWIAPYPIAAPRMPVVTGMEKKMFSRYAIKNTVVIVPINSGMLTLADNMLCSLSATSFDVKKIIFWALDDEAEEVLDARGFATFRDSTLYGVSQDSNHNGGTPQYRKMMRERPKFFADLLSTGYDMLMMDADTVFYQTPEVIIPDRDAVDIVYSTDNREFYQVKDAFHDVWRRGSLMPPVCNGLFWMKGTDKTVKLWQDMIDVFDAGWRTLFLQLVSFQDDQRGADYLLNDGRAKLIPPYPGGIEESIVPFVDVNNDTLMVQLLDQTQVVNGHLLKYHKDIYNENLKHLRSQGKDRIAAHFNWDAKEITKEEGAKQHGMYFLDADGNCVISSHERGTV